jgi:hypothetical protein
MNTCRRASRAAIIVALTVTSLAIVLHAPAAASTATSREAPGVSGRPARRRPTADVTLRVIDDDGGRLSPAVVFACPYADGVANCDHVVAASTRPNGTARLTLQRDVRYDISAFVEDPDPPWACPGLVQDGHERYFATNPFTATPDRLAKRTSLVINRPTPYDCLTVSVTDDAGDALVTAAIFICPLGTDGTPCAAPSFDGPDPDGVIRLDLEPGVTYRLNAFIANSGWACPGFVDPANGATFHFSPTKDVNGADLVDGTTTFVIHHPDTGECDPPPDAAAVVTVLDDAGNALPSAGMFVCPLAPDGTPCPGPSLDGPDPDGVIRLDGIAHDVTYRLNAFIANSGWPCPDYVDPASGATFHFSPARDIAGGELIGHTSTFVIHRPAPDECATGGKG